MSPELSELFARYGYFVILAGVLLENAGVPAPGHTVVLAGAFLASRGTLSLAAVMAVTAASAVVGDNIGYWIGRRGGRRLIERHGRLIRLTPARLANLEAFFAKHGAKAVVIARFVTGLQTVGALFAGISGMRWPLFFAFNVLGAVLWTCVYCALGYWFGQSWDLLHKWIGRAGLFALALVAALAFFSILRRHRAAISARLERVRWLLVPAISLGALGVFAKIAEEMQEHQMTAIDRAVSLLMHRLDSPLMDAAMRAFSFLGSFPAVAAVVLAAVIWRLRAGDRKTALTLVLVALVTELLNFALKEAFQRPRPSLFQEIATLHSYSFPSGHAMASAAVYGSVAAILARAYPARQRTILFAACILVLLIGLSRVFLGVHWITDVLAGWAAGAFVALLATLVRPTGAA